MLTHLYTARLRRSPVPVTFDLYADDGVGERGAAAITAATGAPTELGLLPGSKLRWERVETTYGRSLYASFGELTFSDPGDAFRETFAGYFAEADYLVVVSAPAHVNARTGTAVPAFVWYGRPLRSKGVRTIAPVVHPFGAVTLRVYDGLASLSRTNGAPTLNRTLAETLVEPLLRLNRHLNCSLALDAYPPDVLGAGATTRDPGILRFTGELAGDAGASRGDYGTVRDQVDRALEGMGLVCYLDTTPDADGPDGDGTNGAPVWRVAPRSGLGGLLTDVWHASGYGVTITPPFFPAATYEVAEINVLADEVALAAGDIDDDEEGGEEVDACAVVKLTQGVVGSFVRGVLSGETWLSLGDGETEEENIGVFAPTPNVFLRFRFEKAFVDAGPSGGGSGSPGVARVRLDSADGTSYWLDEAGAWQSTEQGFSAAGATITATEPFPAPGDVYVVAVGESDGTLGDATFRRYRAVLVDEGGAVIADWVVAINAAELANGYDEGEIVTLRRPPPVDAFPGIPLDWEPVTAWESVRYTDAGAPRSFSSLGAYIARDRLQQQARPLAAPRATAFGLHGPSRRLRVPAANLHRDAAEWPAGVSVVVGGGLVLDLDAGETEGSWTEHAADLAEPNT